VASNDVRILLVAKNSNNGDFEELLKEIFPSEIPLDIIDKVVLEFKDGQQAIMNHKELNEPLPTSPNKTWQNMIKAFSNVSKVSIVVDVRKIERAVDSKVGSMLDKFFD
jgi:hypothetical protein